MRFIPFYKGFRGITELESREITVNNLTFVLQKASLNSASKQSEYVNCGSGKKYKKCCL